MRWAEPIWLLLILAPLLLWWIGRRGPSIAWPSIPLFFGQGPRGRAWMGSAASTLQGLAVAALAVALARPQTVGGQTRIASEGVAIVVVLDCSSSMNAADFSDEKSPSTRIDSARRTVARFVEGRPDDLIGLVAFANLPDLTCPPTLDHRFVLDAVRSLPTARTDDDGTNLGDAIVWAADALKETRSIRKRMILLSDGRNSPQRTRGHEAVEPIAAARLARGLGVVIDTVAIGDEGGLVRGPVPGTDLKAVSEVGGPDLELLREIAGVGQGVSFRAKDEAALASALEQIDALEKSPFETQILTRFDERFAPYALSAAALLGASVALRAGRGRRLP